MVKWLVLCDKAWELYFQAILAGKWTKYLHHRRNCSECRIEIRS